MLNKADLKDYRKLKFDSVEEYIVYLYLLELKKANFIKSIICQPEPFILNEGLEKKFYKNKPLKIKVRKEYRKRKHLINPHIYTADFKIIWEEIWKTKAVRVEQNLHSYEYNEEYPFISFYNKPTGVKCSYLEVKPSFDRHNMTRLFTTRTQPWVMEKYKTFVQLIKPYELMKRSFVPATIRDELYYKKNTAKHIRGESKFSWKYKTLQQYLDDRVEDLNS